MNRKTAVALILVWLWSVGAWASTETVLWNFGGSKGDGASPYTNSPISDSKGNLYGVTLTGGNNNAGAVFELSPDGNGGYTETVLYDFCSKDSCSDGYSPYGGLVLDKQGNLYGTTSFGVGCHNSNGMCGAVYELSPNGGGGWTETILYGFCASGGNCTDGAIPTASLTIDKHGNLYGTTSEGGIYDELLAQIVPLSYFGPCDVNGCGTVFELTPDGDGGWTEKILHSFAAYGDGQAPYGGVILDGKGNLYGTTYLGGGANTGTVFKLTPNGDGTWQETVLHSFGNGKDGVNPAYQTLSRTKTGNLYGTTLFGGANNIGTVWELVYSKTNDTYKEKVLSNFSSSGGTPIGGVLRGSGGALYGTTETGGANGRGAVFSLTKSKKRWTQTLLYSFSGSNGGNPTGDLLMDANGNLYGMAQRGGTHNAGVVYKISP